MLVQIFLADLEPTFIPFSLLAPGPAHPGCANVFLHTSTLLCGDTNMGTDKDGDRGTDVCCLWGAWFMVIVCIAICSHELGPDIQSPVGGGGNISGTWSNTGVCTRITPRRTPG